MLSLLGLLPLGFSLLFGLKFYKILTKGADDPFDYLKYALVALGCFALSFFVIRLGWRLALGADMSDPDSNSKPKMRL